VSARANAILDVSPELAMRRALPEVLSQVLGGVVGEMRACEFDPSGLVPERWVWGWNPDLDGKFEDWLAGTKMDIFWPDSAGLHVQCGAGVTLVLTGVRWRLVRESAQLLASVSAIAGAIGRRLGARRCLLVPDTENPGAVGAQDLFYEGASYPEVERALQSNAASDFLDCSDVVGA
jgi:hypothetical protein